MMGWLILAVLGVLVAVCVVWGVLAAADLFGALLDACED